MYKEVLFVAVCFVELAGSEENFAKKLSEVLYSLLEVQDYKRHARSNESVSSYAPESTPASTTIYNYWLSQKGFSISTPKSEAIPNVLVTKGVAKKIPYRRHRARLQELKEEIAYQNLLKRTNGDFIDFLDREIYAKKAELAEKELKIARGYKELNRTREALFAVYRRTDGLEELRRKVREKEAEFWAAQERVRCRRDAVFGTPWVRINYPTEVEDVSEGETLDIASSTMSVRELVWKSLRKFIPFQKREISPEGTIPLEIHYRLGRDVAEITIELPEAPTSPSE